MGDGPCTMYCGPAGAGNYVKMVHNGIEYGDMQLIAEVYDVLQVAGGFDNAGLQRTFAEWNKGELQSYLVEITAAIFGKKDDGGDGPGGGGGGGGYVVDKILDQTGASPYYRRGPPNKRRWQRPLHARPRSERAATAAIAVGGAAGALTAPPAPCAGTLLPLRGAGMKGTGRWTVQEAAELSVPCSTITAALDMR